MEVIGKLTLIHLSPSVLTQVYDVYGEDDDGLMLATDFYKQFLVILATKTGLGVNVEYRRFDGYGLEFEGYIDCVKYRSGRHSATLLKLHPTTNVVYTQEPPVRINPDRSVSNV